MGGQHSSGREWIDITEHLRCLWLELLRSSLTAAIQTQGYYEARWLCEGGHEVTIHAFDRLENLLQEEDIRGVKILRHRVGKTPLWEVPFQLP